MDDEILYTDFAKEQIFGKQARALLKKTPGP
jgi:hypothetical protein